MNTLPDLSQLTHEQLLEFTRQLAMQHQSLAQSNQELEKSNQQLDTKVQHLEVSNQQLDAQVQHLSILNQKYEHELALFKKHKFGSKTNISPQNKSISGMKRSKKILQPLIWNWNG